LIALEMAQRLTEAGKPVALLALLDSYPHPQLSATRAAPVAHHKKDRTPFLRLGAEAPGRRIFAGARRCQTAVADR
jgi:thioesterase domain-containing protein